MPEPKSFDCVEMKNAIQARLREKYAGLTDVEIESRRRHWLETSDHPLARWWRAIDATRRRAESTVRK
jgi:hypothetical protein